MDLNRPIGLAHPSLSKPLRMPFGDIHVAPERFQVRDADAATLVDGTLLKAGSRRLTKELKAIMEGGSALDPMIVWSDPQDGLSYLIDGHHRHDAMVAAGVSPGRVVWVQTLRVPTAAEAREVALWINRRTHLNMDLKEVHEAYWRLLVAGETTGSVREQAARYQVKQTTVHRMMKAAPEVRAQLQSTANSEGVNFDADYVRESAPRWKELSTWRDAEAGIESMDVIEGKEVERIVRDLTLRHGETAKANPQMLVRALREFLEGATGGNAKIELTGESDGDEDF